MAREDTQYKAGKDHPYFGKSSPAKGKSWTLSKETRERMSKAQKGKSHPWQNGDLHHRWKGDAVGYTALHDWVRQRLGTPENCEHCPKTGLKGNQIDWANKSGEYKRDLSDWMRLCRKCHKKYDIALANNLSNLV